jgi:hypothetical protein
LSRFGDAHNSGPRVKVKDWDRKDFNSMYVVTISEAKATFDQKHEGLDGQPDACPH